MTSRISQHSRCFDWQPSLGTEPHCLGWLRAGCRLSCDALPADLFRLEMTLSRVDTNEAQHWEPVIEAVAE